MVAFNGCEIKHPDYISKLPWGKLQSALSLLTTNAVSPSMLAVTPQEV